MSDDENEGPINASLDDDEAVEQEGDEDEEGKKGGFDAKKILLFVVAPLLVLGGAGGGLYFTGMLDSVLGKGAEEHAEADGEHGEEGGEAHGDDHAAKDTKKKKSKKKDDHGDGHGDGHGDDYGSGPQFLKTPDIIVNLNTPDSQPRYLRLSVQLELDSSDDKAAVEAIMPRVIDQFQTYLRELRVRDLRGNAGIYRLQIELLARVNAAAYPVEVKDVLFQEILIQ